MQRRHSCDRPRSPTASCRARCARRTATLETSADLYADCGLSCTDSRVIALPVALFTVFLLLSTTLDRGNDNPFFVGLLLGLISLIAGLAVPWVGMTTAPGHWVADWVGLL